MTKILGSEWFSDDPKIRAALYLDEIAGRYHSNWDALRFAASSSFLSAARAFGDFLAGWERMNAKTQPRGESSFVLELNYQCFVFGPVLSAVFLAATALESFLRLCCEVALAGEGLSSSSLQLAVAGYDARPQPERLTEVLALTQAKALPRPLASEVQALVAFRNACAHDAPVLFTKDGMALHVKRGRIKDAESGTLYPPLHSAVITLTIEHARRAVRAHDGVVSHVAEHASSAFKDHISDLCPSTRLQGIEDMPLMKNIEKHVDAQITMWTETVSPWRESISNAEQESVYRSLVRKLQLRVSD